MTITIHRKIHEKDSIQYWREQWLEQLRNPESEKVTGMLEDPHCENARCCLGHACYALGIEREESVNQEYVYYDGEWEVLSGEVAEMLDITQNGNFVHDVNIADYFPEYLPNKYMCLSDLNDRTSLKPQQIAVILEDQFAKGNMCHTGWIGD